MVAINFKTSECSFGYLISKWKEGSLEAYVRDEDEESYWTLERDGVEVASGTASYDEEDEQNHFTICEQQATIAILLEKLKQKEAELSEIKKGLSVDKAKAGEVYFTYNSNGDLSIVKYDVDAKTWCLVGTVLMSRKQPILITNSLHPLPSDTQEGEIK